MSRVLAAIRYGCWPGLLPNGQRPSLLVSRDLAMYRRPWGVMLPASPCRTRSFAASVNEMYSGYAFLLVTGASHPENFRLAKVVGSLPNLPLPGGSFRRVAASSGGKAVGRSRPPVGRR